MRGKRILEQRGSAPCLADLKPRPLLKGVGSPPCPLLLSSSRFHNPEPRERGGGGWSERGREGEDWGRGGGKTPQVVVQGN